MDYEAIDQTVDGCQHNTIRFFEEHDTMELSLYTYTAARQIYGAKLPKWVETRIEEELALIRKRNYEEIYYLAYELTYFANQSGLALWAVGKITESFVAGLLGFGLPKELLLILYQENQKFPFAYQVLFGFVGEYEPYLVFEAPAEVISQLEEFCRNFVGEKLANLILNGEFSTERYVKAATELVQHISIGERLDVLKTNKQSFREKKEAFFKKWAQFRKIDFSNRDDWFFELCERGLLPKEAFMLMEATRKGQLKSYLTDEMEQKLIELGISKNRLTQALEVDFLPAKASMCYLIYNEILSE